LSRRALSHAPRKHGAADNGFTRDQCVGWARPRKAAIRIISCPGGEAKKGNDPSLVGWACGRTHRSHRRWVGAEPLRLGIEPTAFGTPWQALRTASNTSNCMIWF